jgi:hypothetical protein
VIRKLNKITVNDLVAVQNEIFIKFYRLLYMKKNWKIFS